MKPPTLNIGTLKQSVRLLKPLRPLLRHHYFILTMALLIMLIAAVYLVDQSLRAPSDQQYQSEKSSSGINARFDEQTIQKIEDLQRSTEAPSSQPSLPPGTRSNPFAE